MEQLKRIYAAPHELLHVLALRLIGGSRCSSAAITSSFPAT